MRPPSSETGPIGLGLDDLDRRGRFSDRRDRKYVVDDHVADDLVRTFADRIGVLEIDGRRSFRYETTYFDTPDLDLFVAAARGRRRRYKIRKRLDVDSATAVGEVKTTDGLGRTFKHRRPTDPRDLAVLDPGDRAFAAGAIGDHPLPAVLLPTLTTAYRRTTALDHDDGFRMTIDRHLVCTDVNGRAVHLDGHVVIEVKSTASRTDVDRWLWAHGSRPVRFSKYATALAATRDLVHHRWHRQLRLLAPADT